MLSLVDIIIVALFLIYTLYKGLRTGERDANTASYLLGGRALTLPAFVATTVSTWYGGILGVGEYGWSYGISNWVVFCVPYYVGALLFALVLSHRARASESLTLPSRFHQFYGPKAARCAAVLIFLTTVPAAYVLMMGTMFSTSFGIPVTAGILTTAIFVVIYLWRGGFKAVVKTDFLQFALMFGGFIVLTLMLLFGYGTEPLQTLPPSHLDPTGGLPLSDILIWYVIALGTLAEPNFFQRAFAAKTPKIARKGLLLSILCWLFFDIMTTTCGLYARALLPDLQDPVQAFPQLASAVLPIGILGIFYASLFATILSSLDSGLFTAATTFGHDLLPQNEASSSLKKTKIGLIIGAAIAAVIACSAGSVVKIWKIFGSVSAASLLIPILSTYYSRIKMSRKGALILMILSSITTIAWFAYKPLTDSKAYILGLDPLLAGGSVAILCFIIDLAVQHKKNASKPQETQIIQ